MMCVCTRRRVCPPSPLSALALQRLRPPSSAAWAEFLNASANGKMERDFALLTLTDGEQRELYEAARIIQNAFRRYKVHTHTHTHTHTRHAASWKSELMLKL